MLFFLGMLACSVEEKPVIEQAEYFAKDILLTPAVEYAPTLSADGKQLYFSKSKDQWGGPMKSSVYFSSKQQGQWSAPVLAAFSGDYDDSDPYLTKDGNYLYFTSRRSGDSLQTHSDIWRLKKAEDGSWGAPVRLESPINSPSNEFSPRTDAEGNLYFASDRPGGLGQGDLYICRLEAGHFLPPVNLGKTINTDKGEWNLEINSRGDILIFEASQRKENRSSYGDLYISFKKDQRWTIPQNISELNTGGSDLSASFYAQESKLLYASTDSLRSPDANILSIPIAALIKRYQARARLP